MGRARGVKPERDRLTLSDGDWVDVKRELNAGEYRKLLYSQFKDAPAGDGGIVLDPERLGISKLLAYLLGWSLVSVVDQQPIAYDPQTPEDQRRAALDDLDQDTYRELIAAVTAHETAQEATRAAQKKTLPTAPAS